MKELKRSQLNESVGKGNGLGAENESSRSPVPLEFICMTGIWFETRGHPRLRSSENAIIRGMEGQMQGYAVIEEEDSALAENPRRNSLVRGGLLPENCTRTLLAREIARAKRN